ncbi:Uu.00g000700.m01.CDS01 [Anthostomella pinea]|uniref:Uu.00g000700.m01.CDS01 n=1 Tax=Anthostomella pinea TaxID=933095 RepID=A0AAI8YIC4_9PEZI|nr:Uu.00g000700.m01.CDS01 [Anthostomella pinea]
MVRVDVLKASASFLCIAGGNAAAIKRQDVMATGTSLAKCPVKMADYDTKYRICPDTDFVGTSNQIIDGVADVDACAKKCAQTDGCEKAVFDTKGKVCHVKDTYNEATLLWKVNDQFTTIQVEATIDVAKQGSWTDIIRLPVIPVTAYIVPEFPEASRMLVFSSWGDTTFGGESGYTQFADYNFKTGATSALTVTNTHHDMFCPGISSLEDGRILITGGSDADKTSFYNPATNAFTEGPVMEIARGYQSQTTLSNGNVFTIGGSYSGGRGGKNGEVYDPATDAWTLLDDALVEPMLTTDHERIWREDNHGWLYGWSNESVFQAGPSKTQHWYGTTGDGSVKEAGVRDTVDAMCASNVMYDALNGKIFSAGDAQDYDKSAAYTSAHITTIGEPGTASKVERVADMSYPRGFSNAVVLPDGTILITGGQRKSLVFTDTDGILTPELLDPQTKRWTKMAPEAVARNYHSESLLLPDGTVWSGGGGMCYVSTPGASDSGCDTSVNHADGQIFSPPYLFNADGSAARRPVITSLAETAVPVGGTLTVNVEGNPCVSFALVRIGTATHPINTDQRRIPLTGHKRAGGSTYDIALPEDSGKLLPGHYYVFALNKRGTPSMAKTVRITL